MPGAARSWLITGASRGLGRHLALLAAARGDRVIAGGRDAAALQALAAEVEARGQGSVQPLLLDLAQPAGIGIAVQAAVAAAAGVDVVVNNAGFGAYKPLADHGEDELVRIVQVNLTALIQVCHAVLPALQTSAAAGRRPHIVNIGSDLGRRPLANMAAYAAAKHGVTGFTHSLLRELKGAGIKVSLVNPGIIDTDFGGAREGSRDENWSLRPQVLATLIGQLIDQPGSTVVDEISVHPLGQGDF
jgi:short-subunit dehydrogenase